MMKKEEASELQRKWLTNEENRMERLGKNKIDVRIPEKYKEMTEVNAALRAENVSEDVAPRSTVLKSAPKEIKEMEDKFYIGVMRNPKISMERSWKMKETAEEKSGRRGTGSEGDHRKPWCWGRSMERLKRFSMKMWQGHGRTN